MVRYALVAILWLCPALAAAQNASDPKAAANELFKDGKRLIAAGDVDQACAKFEASLQRLDQFGVRLNLADCHERQGRTATAWAEFRELASQAEKRSDDRAAYARQRADALKPRFTQLKISVPPASRLPGLAVQRDGVVVSNDKLGGPFPVDPGSYIISASAPGYQPWSTKVDVTKPGQIVTVELPRLPEIPEKNAPAANPEADKQPPKELTAADRNLQPSNPSATSPASPQTSSKVVPLAVGAGVLALLGTGLGFELRAESKYDEAKAEMMSQSRRESLYNSANTKRYVAEALAVSGLAAGGAAVWLYLRSGNHERDATTGTTVHVVPTTTGLALSGQF